VTSPRERSRPTVLDRYPVLIIDDHELFSATLGMALRAEDLDASTVPVAEVPDFLRRPAVGGGGLVVLDLDLGRDAEGRAVDGACLVGRLRARGWQVLVVTGSADRTVIASAVAAGAIGYVPKSSSFPVLLDTVVAATRGSAVMTEVERRDWIEQHERHQARERQLSHRFARLTPREQEVLGLLNAGMRAAAISEHFVVSMPTVRTQIRSILTKLGVGSQLEAVALLRELSTQNDLTVRDD
jgi:DNA-binding NarL/FixJ family response regulator